MGDLNLNPGFKIVFYDADGCLTSTWLGSPFSSVADVSRFSEAELKLFVLFAFDNAHPGSTVVSCTPCTFSDYQVSQ